MFPYSISYLGSQRGHSHHHPLPTVPRASPSSEQDTSKEEGVVCVIVWVGVCACLCTTKMSYSMQKMSPPLGPSLRSSSSITSSTCTSSRMSVCACGSVQWECVCGSMYVGVCSGSVYVGVCMWECVWECAVWVYVGAYGCRCVGCGDTVITALSNYIQAHFLQHVRRYEIWYFKLDHPIATFSKVTSQ